MDCWRWEQIARVLTNPLVGVELGVKEGRFTEYLLKTFPELTMFAVDLWRPKPPSVRKGYETYDTWDFNAIEKDFQKRTERFAGRCVPLRADTLVAANFFRDATVDFVFIDAEHTYEAVTADIAAWRPKLKPGGLLSGHDYGPAFPQVIRAVDELKPGPVAIGSDKVWMMRV